MGSSGGRPNKREPASGSPRYFGICRLPITNRVGRPTIAEPRFKSMGLWLSLGPQKRHLVNWVICIPA